MCAPTSRPSRTADPVEAVADRLSVSSGRELARSLLNGVGAEAVERHGPFSAALGAVRAVCRRLDADVPEVYAAASALDVDPCDAVGAEQKLESELSPPGRREDVERLTESITTYAVLLDALENGVAAADLSASVDVDSELVRRLDGNVTEFDPAAVREHLARLRADRAMAQLGFRLYDVARDDAE